MHFVAIKMGRWQGGVGEASSLCFFPREQSEDASLTCEKFSPNDITSSQETRFDDEKMQALVKRERGPGIWLEEVPIPTVGEFDVLIRVLRSSICGTDVHISEWDSWAQRTIPTPMPIGHEFVGIVESVGNHVVDFQGGMIVIQSGLDISPVVTHRLPYLEFEQAFQLMTSGQSGKIILQWSD